MSHDAQTIDPTSAAARKGAPKLDGGEPARSAMAREYHNLLTDLEELMSSAASLTGEELVRAKARLGARIASARAAASHAGDVITERVREGAQATNTYVHAQPWQAIGITAVAGVLLGFLLGRRSS